MIHPARVTVLRSIPSGLFLSTMAAMVVIACFGFASLDISWIHDNRPSPASPFAGKDLGQILLRNVGAAFVLYSGIVTLGLTTILAGSILSLYVGATMSLGVNSVGVGQLLADVVWYVPLEFGGLVLAATAGLQPVAGALRAVALDGTKISLASLQHDLLASLRTFALATVLIAAGAVIESLLISVQTA